MEPFVLVLAGVFTACLACLVVLLKCYRRVGPQEALLLERGTAPTRVCLGNAWVLPLLWRAEVMDLSVRKIVVERRGRQGLSCRDGIRVDVRATFLVKVERAEKDILRVAQNMGCERANRSEEVQALLEETFACALVESASTFNFDELMADRSFFIEHVMMEVGSELLGFKLERMSLGRLDQTPLDQLDPTNIRDAQGIQTLTERATRLAIDTAGSRSLVSWMDWRERELTPESGITREVQPLEEPSPEPQEPTGFQERR